jgi:hypothetical protein
VRISSRVFPLSCLFSLVVTGAVGCGDGKPKTPITDATSITCPMPGELPFRMQTTGFQVADNATTVMLNSRDKDAASDTLGNPGGGPIADVYINDKASPAPGSLEFTGLKSRTLPNQGFFDNALAGEFVSMWTYSGTSWQMIGRTVTDMNGNYDVTTNGYPISNTQPIYNMLEADGSCAISWNYVYPAGTQFVVFDIDGTLTLSDEEFLDELADDTYVPKLMGGAVQLVQAWVAKGYHPVYLTARAHDFRADTRSWLELEGFPRGAIITSVPGDSAQPFKTLWMTRMIKSFGWVFVAAYGNMDTDIGAYQAVDIPNAVTFIVGQYGGDLGSTAIPNMDYTDHIATYVAAQPDAPAGN